jgi:hypothetical protein
MEGNDIIPKGNVFPTEVMNAQPGLNNSSSQMGIYSDFDPAELPEKTKGEMLAEANEERRKSIQGEAKDKEWSSDGKSAARGISDTFGDELKKHLK